MIRPSSPLTMLLSRHTRRLANCCAETTTSRDYRVVGGHAVDNPPCTRLTPSSQRLMSADRWGRRDALSCVWRRDALDARSTGRHHAGPWLRAPHLYVLGLR